MNLFLQRNWNLTARLEGGRLIADATYCGTDRELSARLAIDTTSLRILNAVWEIYRAPGFSMPRIIEIPELKGLEAYFGCGAELRKALSFLHDRFAAGLFSDAVRAVIQAETFLFKERGFSSSAEFEKNWTNEFNSPCRYYSNMERVTQDWYEHIGYDERSGNLFNRIKTQILTGDKNDYIVSGHLNDSFHGIAAGMLLDENGTVKQAGGVIVRAPDKVCKEATDSLATLLGKNITILSKKDIAFLLGNNQGCIHLIDLVTEGAETFKLFLDEMMRA